ncbi:LodA/GoxA family CTQ-dependent oxidase [Brasilonema sp. UFV-L1]|uniref:LodA/GoxA family CTQ-dependent oxidase n=1 Tax=Brasilonema sp. UFV-L1 TaxID=2234130 RepID=UPI00145F3CFC|nr:LodA/GoxA family CTQ-dependent oxidase [Brasilonema sp. UFV-L1]NMG07490.1 hypothetical protein [Brasilonema sp. UFV-L1]
MAKIYKIHPSIGIARVGNSPTQFYIGSEIPGASPIEIVNGVEQPLAKYKDENGLIKRQAARFRVFEYEQDDATGALSAGREITSDEATIEWQVHVANRKPAWNNLNPDIPQDQLINDPGAKNISGQQQQGVEFQGKCFGVEVYLGELKTDSLGRLLVLGGRGNAASPFGEEVNFIHNPKWYDDISDGPVTAKITFAGQPPQEVNHPAWVIVGPSDFAPEIQPLVTLYDIAYQIAVDRGWLSAPSEPSFKFDIFPILNRAASLRWVNDWNYWNGISQDWKKLSDKQDPTAQPIREQTFNRIRTNRINSLQLTQVQLSILNQWRNGNYKDDWTTPTTPDLTVTPEKLDQAALEACIGGGFEPGIEAGESMTKPEIYSEAFRLSHTVLVPGEITEEMSIPWQADFWKCGTNWWPSQRPNRVQLTPESGPPRQQWEAGISSHSDMVNNFSKLGFVVQTTNSAGAAVFIEQERNSDFPRP